MHDGDNSDVIVFNSVQDTEGKPVGQETVRLRIHFFPCQRVLANLPDGDPYFFGKSASETRLLPLMEINGI
jgi:hypothetical protein